MLNLPDNCKVNTQISKQKFYDKISMPSNIKEEFINVLDKIIWLYKLSPNTLNIDKTDNIEEIQVFELQLKEQKIPKNVIKAITKSIPYKILFVLKYKDSYCYAIKVDDIYYTQWNEEIKINFNGINNENIYQNIVKSIIKANDIDRDFEQIIEEKKRKEELSRKINILENKIRQEKQFNRKVELNQELRKLQNEIDEIIM